MSLLPAYFGPRKRDGDSAPELPPDSSEDDIFRLVPPRAEDIAAEILPATKFQQFASIPTPAATQAEPAFAAQPVAAQPLAAQPLADLPKADPAGEPSIPPPPATVAPPRAQAPTAPAGRDVRAPTEMDLTRLSIDNDGRLYWDGKPVEVRRRLMMSRAQIAGATAVAALVAIAATGAAVQGLSVAHEWACTLGWTESYCKADAPEPPAPPRPRFDIPA